MADSEIRSRARGEGDLEEQAHALRERLRAGDFSEDALEFCAYLGHEPAQVALGRPWPLAQDLPIDRWQAVATREVWISVLKGFCSSRLDAYLVGGPNVFEREFSALVAWAEQGGEGPIDLGYPPLRHEELTYGGLLRYSVGLAQRLEDWEGPSDRVGSRSGDRRISGAIYSLEAPDFVERVAADVVFALLGVSLLARERRGDDRIQEPG